MTFYAPSPPCRVRSWNAMSWKGTNWSPTLVLGWPKRQPARDHALQWLRSFWDSTICHCPAIYCKFSAALNNAHGFIETSSKPYDRNLHHLNGVSVSELFGLLWPPEVGRVRVPDTVGGSHQKIRRWSWCLPQRAVGPSPGELQPHDCSANHEEGGLSAF